jgi:hypothetical protein
MDRTTLAMLEAIAAMSLAQKQARYLELATRVAELVTLTRNELDELIILRNSLQKKSEHQTI